MSASGWSAIGVALLGVLVLVLVQRRHLAAVRADRAALFAPARGVLGRERLQPRGLDYPVLSGLFEGREVRVEPVLDTMGFRTVPVLRLVVSMRHPLAGQPRLSVLGEESGQEFYAGHRGLVRVRDERWPARVSVACADAGIRGVLVDQVVEAVDQDPRLKQILLTDAGVRCVVRAAQADSATYRVTRRADLSGTRVSAALLAEALSTASAVCDAASRPTTVAR